MRVGAIETGRNVEPADHLAAARRVLHALRSQLVEMSPADWSRVGLHSTLGELDVAGQLQHFLIGHYEEHADQLDDLLAK